MRVQHVLVATAGAWLAGGCSSTRGDGPVLSIDAAGAADVAVDQDGVTPMDRASPEEGADDVRDASADRGGPGDSSASPDAPVGPPLARAWVLRSSPVSTTFESLAASEAVIVAAGQNSVVISNDGVNWRIPRTPVIASEVAFGAGTFVAASQTGDVSWSTDGETWTTVLLPETAKDPGVAFGAGTFALVAHAYGEGWYASPDGRRWTKRSVEPSDIRSRWNFVFTTFGVGGRLFASKATPLPEGNFVTTDGATWSLVPEWKGITYDIAFNGAIYCATGSVGFTHRSSDGVTWSSSMTVAESLLGVTSLDGKFYLAGSFGTVLASHDCVTWEEGASPRMPMNLPSGEQLSLQGIRTFKDRLVVVGTAGYILTSP